MRIVLSGLGRAGRALAELVVNGRRDEITCAVCRDTSSDAGSTVGEAVKVTALSNCPVYPLKLARSAIAFSSADVLIDFSDRSFTLDLFDLAREKGWGLVVCTTDHEPEVVSAIRRHAESGEIGVVYAPNLTLGVNLLLEFTRRLSKVLPDFDFATLDRVFVGESLPCRPRHVSSPTLQGVMTSHRVCAGGRVCWHTRVNCGQ